MMNYVILRMYFGYNCWGVHLLFFQNLYTVKMIKYQVQAREIVTKNKEIEQLKAQLAQFKHTIEQQEQTILEQQKKIDCLQVRRDIVLNRHVYWNWGNCLKVCKDHWRL